MKNIHILPTDKPSRLYKTGSFLLLDSRTMPNNTLETKNQYIYITNSEEVKEGDWIFNEEREPSVLQCIGKGSLRGWNKIILTTDQSLIQDGVQAIDDEFLEWFVKNPSCEEININRDWGYPKIIIPKEEPKQETLEEAAEKYIAKDNNNRYYNDFIAGAKWQQERSYSEEDMIEFGFSTYCYISELMGVPFNLMSENRLNAEEWFEQFKKK